MAYSHTNSKGKTYYLHSREVNLRGGKAVRIFWFAKEVNQERALDKVPDGYEVIESQKTGLPLLRKKKKE